MNTILKLLIESTLILSVFYAIYILFFAHNTNFNFSRTYLISSLTLAMVIPSINIPVLPSGPANGFTLTFMHDAFQLPELFISDPNEVSVITGFDISVAQALLIVYLVGLLLFLSRFLFEILNFFLFIHRNGRKTEQYSFYKLIHTGGRIPTSSFFNYLFWDETRQVGEAEKKQMIRHEEGHISKRHSYDIIYLEIIKIIFWFNPLIYAYRRALTMVHEYQADAYVLDKNPDRPYLNLLARQSLTPWSISLNHHFSKSIILKRIKMIKSTQRRSPWLQWILSLLTAGLMFYLFACETKNNPVKSEPEVSYQAENEAAEEDPGEIYSEVDVSPLPEGGLEGFYNYIVDNLKYPEQAKKEGIEGKVFVRFVITKNGFLSQVQVIKGMGHGLDEEALRVVSSYDKKWKPGIRKGEPVNTEMVLPISYAL